MKCLLRGEGDNAGVEYHCYPTNPTGELRPLPDTTKGRWIARRLTSPPQDIPLADLTDTPWCVEYLRESPLVRGPAVAETPAPGVVRIAGIGDSFAMGEGVPYEKTLFVRVAEFLGPGVEILNCAESGLDTAMELHSLEMVTANYHVSRALVVFTLNDVALGPAIRARMGGVYDLVNLRTAQLDPTRPWLLRASRVAAFAASSLEMRRITRETMASYLDAYDPARNAEGLGLLAAQLRRFATWPGCRVGLVLYPLMVELDDYPLQRCHDRVAAMARDAGLPVLDLAPAFAGQDASALHAHPIDHHPNGRAHETAARAVAAWVRAEPSLRW